MDLLLDTRFVLRQDIGLVADHACAEKARLARREQELRAALARLQALDPFGPAQPCGLIASAQAFVTSLFETRAMRARRHRRMQHIGAELALLVVATERLQRDMARLGRAWQSEFGEPAPWAA